MYNIIFGGRLQMMFSSLSVVCVYEFKRLAAVSMPRSCTHTQMHASYVLLK